MTIKLYAAKSFFFTRFTKRNTLSMNNVSQDLSSLRCNFEMQAGKQTTRSQMPHRGQTAVASRFNGWETTRSQMPHRGLTAVASRFNGWETAGKWGMRAVGTRHTTRHPGRVPKGTPAVAVITVPAIEMAGYPCQMPMASAAQAGRKPKILYIAKGRVKRTQR